MRYFADRQPNTPDLGQNITTFVFLAVGQRYLLNVVGWISQGNLAGEYFHKNVDSNHRPQRARDKPCMSDVTHTSNKPASLRKKFQLQLLKKKERKERCQPQFNQEKLKKKNHGT